jgi:hypothetical protein
VVLTTTLVELEKITSSRGPDQEHQRRQRVYRYLGVQQALVLVQIEMKLNLNEVGNIIVTSLLKNILLDPSGH